MLNIYLNNTHIPPQHKRQTTPLQHLNEFLGYHIIIIIRLSGHQAIRLSIAIVITENDLNPVLLHTCIKLKHG